VTYNTRSYVLIRDLFASIAPAVLVAHLAVPRTNAILKLIRYLSRQSIPTLEIFSLTRLYVHGFRDPIARISGAALRRMSRTRLWGAGQWRKAKQWLPVPSLLGIS
jgi:hypothetical protein